MRQESRFFLSPLIFFGPHHTQDEEEIEEEEEMLSDPWRICSEPDYSFEYQTRIGLFIHWSNLPD